MVQVRQQALVDDRGKVDFDQWLGQLPLELDEPGRERLLDACHFVL